MSDCGQRCSGGCCERFNLSLMPHELKEKTGEQFEKIKSMVIPLGIGLKNISDGKPIDPAKKQIGWHYTCKHFDKEKRICNDYENRPTMCSDYPYGKSCAYPGCTLAGNVGVTGIVTDEIASKLYSFILQQGFPETAKGEEKKYYKTHNLKVKFHRDSKNEFCGASVYHFDKLIGDVDL